MKIYSHAAGAGVTFKEDIQIQTSFRWLLIQITGAATTVTEAELKTALLTWSKAGKKGQETLQSKISVYSLAEVNANREGLFVLNDTTFYAMIEVGDNGAIACSANDYVSLSFSGFQADNSVEIYAIDDAVQSTKVIKYVIDNINSRASQDLDLRGTKALFVPVAAMSKISLIHMVNDAAGEISAKSISYTPEELRGQMLLNNEIVSTNSLSAGSSLVHVSEEFYALGVSAAVRGTIEFNAAQTSSLIYVKSETF